MDPKHLYQLAGRCSQSSLSAYAAVRQLGTRDDHFKMAARGSLMLATLSVWERVWCVYGLARASACVRRAPPTFIRSQSTSPVLGFLGSMARILGRKDPHGEMADRDTWRRTETAGAWRGSVGAERA